MPDGLQLPDDPRLLESIAKEAQRRSQTQLEGIRRYLATPYRPEFPDRPVIWHRGNCRLLDCGSAQDAAQAGQKPVLLLVPSLINKYYIFDLAPEISFASYLQQQGQCHPFILDWGIPGEEERAFDCAAYVTHYLGPAIHMLASLTGRPVTLVGYCMGGLFTLAAAQLFPDKVERLALLATPWDFHAADVPRMPVNEVAVALFRQYITRHDGLEPDDIQMLFHLINPQQFFDKFERYAAMTANSEEARHFHAREYWANDGVRLTPGVATDCYIHWLQQNQPYNSQWVVDGTAITPRSVQQAAFVAAPQNDRVVPVGCARPLHQLLPNSTLTEPQAGHIGMMIGRRRQTQLWKPFVDWMSQGA